VRLLLSGPSGGSAACALLSEILKEDNLIGIDMGGTSFDVSVIRNGRVNVVMQGEVDRMPVRIPMVEIRAIGAGGGSLAKVQRDKRLTVGPESAGSRPGPACYGRGGKGPTVTDANVTLGRLNGENFLGGGMRLDREAAGAAIDTEVAKPLGLSVEAAAEGLLAVVNANLGAAIRLSLFEKGVDPREFTMIAFGGAAGLHAVAVADETGIRRVVFPQNASTLSAYGILHSDLIHDLVRSRVLEAKPENQGTRITAAIGSTTPRPAGAHRRRTDICFRHALLCLVAQEAIAAVKPTRTRRRITPPSLMYSRTAPGSFQAQRSESSRRFNEYRRPTSERHWTLA